MLWLLISFGGARLFRLVIDTDR